MIEPIRPTVDAFIGRSAELRAITDWLQQPAARLLTVLGPAGIGKTRLALEALALAEAHAAERLVLEVASTGDSAMLRASIAQVLSDRSTPTDWDDPQWRAGVAQRQAILLLDGCEAVSECGAIVGELLRFAPQLRVLASSRAALGLRNEQSLTLGPLSLPAFRRRRSIAAISASEAVQLFVQHARKAQPQFQLDTQTAVGVATICRRLDGVPLAIELTAAQLQLLPFAALLNRPTRLQGSADVDPSPGELSLYSAIDRSYRLLSEAEQTLFAGLSVFVGGATLAAIEAIYAADAGQQVAEGLHTLAEQSLIVREIQDDGTPRIRLLAAIRSFAAERLAARGYQRISRRRHAEWYCALAEELATTLSGPQQADSVRRLDHEYDNLRAALSWSLEPYADHLIGLRIAAALNRYWILSNQFAEGREWFDRLLSEHAVGPAERTRLAHPQACAYLNTLLASGQLAHQQRARVRSEADFHEALAWAELLGARSAHAHALRGLGNVAVEQRDFAQAIAFYQASLHIAEALAQPLLIAPLQNNLGIVAIYEQRYDDAAIHLEQALILYEQLGDDDLVSALLTNLAILALQRGDQQQAAGLLQRGLALCLQLDNTWGTAHVFGISAELAALMGQNERAAWLLGAATRYPNYRAQLDRADQERFDRLHTALQNALPADGYQADVQAGQSASDEQAVAIARELFSTR